MNNLLSEFTMTKSTMQVAVLYNTDREDVIVGVKKRSKLMGKFTPIRPLNLFGSKNTEPDLIDLLVKASKPACKIFQTLKNNMQQSLNICLVDTRKFNPTERVNFSKGISELRKLGMVRKGHKQLRLPNDNRLPDTSYKVFMINPELIKNTNCEETNFLWVHCN